MSEELQAEIERLRKANLQLREGAEEQQQRMNYLRKGIFEKNQEIEQTCGKVLGYPWFKDDQKSFPGSTEKDGVCVGDHVAETIVSELASRYTEALARIKRLEEFVDQLTNPKFTRDDLPKEALLQRIKRLEEAGDRIIEAGWSVQDWSGMCVVWAKAKEAKL